MLARRLLATTALAAAAVGVLVTSPAATAAGTKCVALVVDFSHTGGSVSSACVTVATNASGSAVLQHGHKVTFDPRYGNDFICAIDGVPAGGCRATDNTHYWVYYHRAPGSSSWRVSQEGAGTYKPVNASTEGWVYDDGSSSAPAPQNVPYNSICKTTPKTASPSPSATHASARAGSSASPATVQTKQTSAAAAAKSRPSTTTPTRTAASSPSASPTSNSTPALASPLAAAAPPAPTHGASGGHGLPVAVVVAIVAAVGLGGAAALRLRRSSG